MAEIDALTVRLEADIATFQHQLDRARAQLSTFVGHANRGGAQVETFGRSAMQSAAGLRGMNAALLSVTRQMTGMPTIVGRATDVLGTFAIGAGPTVAIVAGMAAIAGGFALITKQAREAAREVAEAIERLKELTAAQLSPELRTIRETTLEMAPVRDELAQVQAGIAQREALGIDNETLRDLRIREAELTDILERAARRINQLRMDVGGIILDPIEAIAEGAETASRKAVAAAKEAYAEIEAMARQREEFQGFLGDLIRPRTPQAAAERMGFVFPDHLKGANNALDDLRNTVEELDRQIQMGPWGVPGKTMQSGFLGQVSGMLDPRQIASGLALGAISSGISFAVSGLAKVGAQLFGLGNASEEAARRMQTAINNIRADIARMRGDDAAVEFFQFQDELVAQIQQLGFNATQPILQAQNAQELQAALEAWRQEMLRGGPRDRIIAGSERMDLLFEWFGDRLKELGKEFSSLTDSLRNIPQGYKIAMPQFNATEPTAAMTGAQRAGMDVRVTFEPDGVFRIVEAKAVQVIRTGGRPAWERFS